MPRTRFQRLLATGLVLTVALTRAALADGVASNGPPAVHPHSPAGRLKAIQVDVADALAAYQAARAKQPEPGARALEVEKLLDAYNRKWEAGRDAALEMAKADPASAVGFDALEWVLAEPAYGSRQAEPALELVIRYHATNPAVGRVAALLGYFPPPPGIRSHAPVVNLLQKVAEKNPDPGARGQAALGLAYQAKWAFEVAEIQVSKGGLKDPAKVAAAERAADQAAHEAEKAYEAVVRDYGACANLRDKGNRPPEPTLGQEAAKELYELRHLRIGKPAPDVAGEDLDGARFKLSDYRGKVVLLVFWASWCSPCMAEVPHERELVDRFRGRPFVLIGVNGDEDKGDAAAVIASHRIPWRSFWNGADRPAGSIVAAYNVRGWPTVYVIDARGVIRAKNLRGKNLDAPLEALVAEAEAMNGRE
jgi:peroxiredoxin